MFEAHCIPRTVALFVGTFLALRYKSGSRRIIRDRGGLQFRIGGNRCVQGLPKLRHFGRDDVQFPWENTDKAAILKEAASL